MTSQREQFDTAVSGVGGTWPRPPERWSYSSLREAEECPRRWMLGRAAYPGVWKRHGYPQLPILPVLVGNVIHNSLELILREVYGRGCQSLTDPCAVEIMKALGGYTRLVDKMIEEQLDQLVENPRVGGRINGLRAALATRRPEMRQRVQEVIGRIALMPGEASEGRRGVVPARGPLGRGSHPEVELRVDELRFVGRADLITVDDSGCVLTDYKTGGAHDHHMEQLRVYALLWSRDTEINPKKLPVRRLVLSYANHDEACEPPTHHELAVAATQLSERVTAAEVELSMRPPPARPAPDMCRLCAVRHLCDEYWISRNANPTPDGHFQSGDFADCEAIVRSQNGPRSWILAPDDGSTSVLLRTTTEAQVLAPGDRVRILNLVVGRDEESGGATLTMTQASEIFPLCNEV